MECLRDYIGVRGCGTTVPPSSIYLNDLAGISMRSLGSLADTQQQTFTGVYRDIQTRALMRLGDDFRQHIGRRYQLKQIGDSVSLPKSRLSTTTASALTINPTDKVGVVIDLDYQFSGDTKQFVTSPLSAPYLQEVWFYCDSGANGDTVTFSVIDIETGVTLYTTTKVCSTGWNKVEVNTVFTNSYFDKSRKIFIGASVTTNNGTLTPQYMNAENLHDTGACCSMRLTGAIMDSTGAVTEQTESFGISAVVGVRCDFGSLICTNKDVFKRALLYCLGMETMIEQLHTDRLSEFSTIRRERAGELLESYTTDYTQAIKQVADGINLDCDCCIECGGSGSYYIVETV